MPRRRPPGQPPFAPQIALAERLLRASDPLSLEGWDCLMSRDIHLRIANRPPVIGHPRARHELHCLFAAAEALGRGFCETWPSEDRETLLLELDLRLRDGTAIPVAIVIRITEPSALARDIRFYLDPAPLARLAAPDP